jgi:putative membrane protein
MWDKWKLDRQVVHLLLRVIVLLGLGYYILYLWQTDQMHYYIAPRMSGLILGSGVVLLVMATHQFYLLLGKLLRTDEADGLACDCEECKEPGHTHGEDEVPNVFRWKQVVGYGLLLFPLLLALVLPEQALSTEIAAKKGMNLTTLASVEAKRSGDAALREEIATEADAGIEATSGAEVVSAADMEKHRQAMLAEGVPGPDGSVIYGGKNGVPRFVSMGDFDREFAVFAARTYPQNVIRVEESRYMEYLTMFDLFLEQFQGKKVEISGFVYRDDTMAADQFVVGRLAVECCSADASPYGVMVKYAEAKRFANNAWVRVTGVVEKSKREDFEVLTLRVVDAVSIPEPKNQYVYPNYDFLKD